MTNIQTLKSLTQITYDSVDGYRKATEVAKSPALKRALEARREKRSATLAALNSGLQELGEEPITSTSMKGDAHQLFMEITEAVKNGDSAAANRVEEGEDYLAEQFRIALDTTEFDAQTKGWVTTALAEISEGERFGDMIEKQYA